MEQQRIHVIVKGRVQGVYYRASTQEQAETLGLTGWVRNMENGDVEFEAQGTQEQLDNLLLWAQKGPTRAQVTSVQCNPLELKTGETGFALLR